MSALPGWWRWMAGMRVIDDCGASYRVTIAGDAYEDSEGTATWINVTDGGDYGPDPTDPATIGCLTARVREVCDDPTVTATCRRCLRIRGDAASGWEDGPWAVTVSSSSVTIDIASGPTEWSALMAAGDAAWARNPTTSNPTTPQGEP